MPLAAWSDTITFSVSTQTDKRNLGQKTMMQEIKDIADKRRLEDTAIHLASTNFSAKLTPDLTYNCREKCASLPLHELQHVSHV